MELIKLEIPNWSKFNPRADRANYTWFRFQNDFFHDEKIFVLSHEEISVYLFLLCTASKKNSGEIEISLVYASAILKLKQKEILNHINGFFEKGMIAVKSRHDGGETAGVIPATYVTNERNETNVTNMADSAKAEPRLVFDFESLYKKYPRKEGKSRGFQICKAQIKSPEDFTCLSKAIDRYSEHIKKNATDPKYIKQFSTFMNSWRDWLDPETGSVTKPPEEIPEWKRLALEKEARERKNAAS